MKTDPAHVIIAQLMQKKKVIFVGGVNYKNSKQSMCNAIGPL